jgi:hypothetical protein
MVTHSILPTEAQTEREVLEVAQVKPVIYVPLRVVPPGEEDGNPFRMTYYYNG